jgi:YesN/AraC family two-component response regulator
LNILVVDDEYFARKAIIQMIRDWNPATVVHETEDGQQAWEKLTTVDIDLVLSDIRMPVVDGLELAARIHEHYPTVTNVIISGFDDFRYAQQAIRYKVEQYLLKPVDKGQLTNILEQFRQRAEWNAERRLQEKLAESLFGNETFALETDQCFTTAVLRCSDIGQRERLKSLVNRIMSVHGVRAVVTDDRRYAHMAVVWMQAPCNSPAGWINGQTRLFKEIIETFGRETGARLSVGVSGNYADVRELRESYKEASDAVLQRLVLGDNRVCFAREPKPNPTLHYEYIDEWSKSLHKKIAKHRTDEAIDMIRTRFDAAIRERLPAHLLRDLCAKAAAAINAVIETANRESGQAVSFLEPVDLHEYDSLADVRNHLTEALVSAAAILRQHRLREDIVENVIRYVQQHFQQDIVLEQLAKNIFFTDPTYLGRVFKKKTGMRFSQYLLSVRMQNAKSMLESGACLTVAEVASAVGFNDSSYFIQMYKRFYGKTPGQSIKSKPATSAP